MTDFTMLPVCRYGVGVSQDHIITKLLECVPMLLQWVEQFMSHTPQCGKGEIEFKRLIITLVAVVMENTTEHTQVVVKTVIGWRHVVWVCQVCMI